MTPNDIAVEVAKAMAARPQQEGITAREYAEARGVTVPKARDELRLLLSIGKLRTFRTLRPAMSGDQKPTPAYALTGKAK